MLDRVERIVAERRDDDTLTDGEIEWSHRIPEST